MNAILFAQAPIAAVNPASVGRVATAPVGEIVPDADIGEAMALCLAAVDLIQCPVVAGHALRLHLRQADPVDPGSGTLEQRHEARNTVFVGPKPRH